jgi:hypothetical protein
MAAAIRTAFEDEGIEFFSVEPHRSGSIARSTSRPRSVSESRPVVSRWTKPFSSMAITVSFPLAVVPPSLLHD